MLPHPTTVQLLLDAAISIVGSQGKLGRATGFSQNAIWHARRVGRVSPELALAIDRATAGVVSRAGLRPDIFGAV
ncbi:transcriptional regulator [Caulobacter sp. NIBR2454]|uniref:transcriptional regulator n=1 Tax=Caulobacter sp. NIBR2454 TaxID=3015996 RepID=UPI003FA4CBDA